MQIHSVGIDLGKTTFHLVALGAAGACEEEVHATTAADVHRKHADVADWAGHVREHIFLGRALPGFKAMMCG